jgi:pimeloyl-ACP methyl ester carboxylesterase
MISIQRGYADLPGGQVHYRTSGTDPGIPIVMFHQTASSSVMFEAVMERLLPRRCIALDTPGFGASTPLDAVTVDGWAEALDAALDSLGFRDMDVVGHHTGASIACAIAVRRGVRVRRLALGGPPLLSAATRERIRAAAREPQWLDDGSHLLSAWRRSSRYAPRGPLGLVQRETLLLLEAHAPHLAMQAVLDYDLGAALDAIDGPLLVFAGDGDPIIEGLATVAARRPGTVATVIPSAGVHVFDEQPEAVAATLTAFFGERGWETSR